MGSKKKVFAFDLGKASVGYCVREGFDIQETGSLIVDKDHAEVASNRDRRRVHKTLKSHKAREKFFNELWQKARLEVPDENLLKKEFSGKSDDTIYISCLLRIALLQNQKLETWQIYKALRNAIQRRGYDAKLPWANAKTKDDEDNEKWAEKYTTDGDLELIKNEEYKYPCYYDAIRLGLWDENNPTEFKRHIPLAGVVKVRDIGLVAPRSMVVAELTKLWESAQKQLENLRTIPVETFLYGERGEAYASYLNKDFKHERGTEKDWTGVLGQKIPRFDNRIIMKCKLLPKRNVCKSATLENVSFTLLMKLKNLRFTNEEGEKAKLSPNDIKAIYGNWLQKATAEKLNTAITKQERDKILSTTITKKEIEDVIGKKSVKDKIEPMKANVSGRSSFCCTACKIMNKIILEGILYPNEMDIAEFVDRPGAQNGITAEEVQTMLEKVGDWNNLYIPDSRNEMAGLSCDTIEQTDIVIGGVTNPIVRNRLQIFRNKLVELIYGTKNKSGYGKPDEVIFEFIRDGVDRSLMPGKKASDMEKYMKEQEKYNAGLREKLGDDYSPTNFEKLKLHEMQDGRCIYSGKRIGIQTDFHRCEIDHIYPRSMGGNDALYNKVLCFSEYNQDKEGRTPYEWLHGDDYKWQEYVDTVKDIYEKNKKQFGKKKYELLTSKPEDCAKLIESYNGLAETGQISRAAQDITALIMGWGLQVAGENRRIFVSNGSSTAAIRRGYGLNRLLGDDIRKNRANDKHHALDAICISFSRDFKYNKEKKKDEVAGLNPEIIARAIGDIMPYPYANDKPIKGATRPDDTIYGKRVYGDKTYITKRVKIDEIKESTIDKIIDKYIKEDFKSNYKNIDLNNYYHPKKKTKVKKVLIRESECKKVEYDTNGRERIGEFCDFGTKGVKSQFKKSKQHKGQILYYDKKGKIKVMPIFANQKTQDAKDKLTSMDCKLYNKGQMFCSGCLVEIPNEFKGGANTYPAGIYKWRTIQAKCGTTKLEDNSGMEILTSASNLIQAGLKKFQK